MFETNIKKTALCSRLLFVLFSSITNFIIPDHKSDAFISPGYEDENFWLDKIISTLFGGLCRWDAQHFYHIALEGYTYENNLAFFPLFPLCVKYLATLIRFLMFHLISFKSSFLIAAFTINSLAFSYAAIALYKLSLIILKNKSWAYRTSLLFCFSPATIFFISPYTESLFSFFTFNGMLCIAQNNTILASFWFFFATSTRSNGLLNIGFILYFYYQNSIKNFSFNFKSIKIITKYIFASLINSVVIILPYFMFQYFSYYVFCIKKPDFPDYIKSYAIYHDFIIPGNTTWCQNSYLPYTYIQTKYWNVGFLKYYTLKQIPNFMLAFPIVWIISWHCVPFICKNMSVLINKESELTRRKLHNELPLQTFPFMVHIFVLTIFCVLNINVQVTTRMIASSSPVLYWIGSKDLIVSNETFFCLPKSFFFTKNFILTYFMLYVFIGIILFCNNFPWT